MKKVILGILCSVVFGNALNAQNNVKNIDLKGKTYTLCEKMPEDIKGDIVGLYEYALGTFDYNNLGNNKFAEPNVSMAVIQSHLYSEIW